MEKQKMVFDRLEERGFNTRAVTLGGDPADLLQTPLWSPPSFFLDHPVESQPQATHCRHLLFRLDSVGIPFGRLPRIDQLNFNDVVSIRGVVRCDLYYLPTGDQRSTADGRSRQLKI